LLAISIFRRVDAYDALRRFISISCAFSLFHAPRFADAAMLRHDAPLRDTRRRSAAAARCASLYHDSAMLPADILLMPRRRLRCAADADAVMMFYFFFFSRCRHL